MPRLTRALAGTALTLSLTAGIAIAARADGPYPSDSPKPDLVAALSGYDLLWQSSGSNDLHGTVLDPGTLGHNDAITSWINQHATPGQQFRALQDSEYDNTGADYDQSITISDGLGSVLGPLYVKGRHDGSLPKTSALINSQTGTTGAYVSTSAPKARFSYPRPYLPSNPAATPVAGDAAGCAPSTVNASSLRNTRTGASYADADGNLKITRVPDTTDTTHAFASHDVALSAGYGTTGICTGGSYPSGHTTTAYQAGFTLATLIPELAPQILARASEAGNDRIVLGVHYPLDIIAGRIDGEIALAKRWGDDKFRSEVLEPARAELVDYLQRECGGTIAQCVARGTSYKDDPYGGAKIPGGTAQTVTDRASALSVFRERLTYGFAATGPTDLAPSVPADAPNLLRTTFPTLNDAQRTSILEQTEIASGYPLDGTGGSGGSWERLDLASAMSATVQLGSDGAARVVATGGAPQVVTPPSAVTPPASSPTPPATTPKPTVVRFAATLSSRRAGRGVTVSVTFNRALTHTAKVRVRVTRSGRLVATRTVTLASGRRHVGFGVSPRRGKLARGTYRVTAAVVAPGVNASVSKTVR